MVVAAAGLAVLGLTACGGDDGVSCAEFEEVVQEFMDTDMTEAELFERVGVDSEDEFNEKGADCDED